ncbi:hypothetical protein C8R43DRAFT_1138889 [Mycena crocata]|nr:hypothetical protein C8R43DRAFT_1138889 [Mycena crocata]
MFIDELFALRATLLFLPPSSPSAMSSFSLDHENCCPKCKAYRVIEFAAGGQNAGHYFIRCIPCKFFYPFALRPTPPSAPHMTPPANWVPPTTVMRLPQALSPVCTKMAAAGTSPLLALTHVAKPTASWTKAAVWQLDTKRLVLLFDSATSLVLLLILYRPALHLGCLD